METVKYDIIDFEKQAPQGSCYAWGFDRNGTTYYALCELDNEIIGTPIIYVAFPFRFSHYDNLDNLMRGFFTQTNNYLKQTA